VWRRIEMAGGAGRRGIQLNPPLPLPLKAEFENFRPRREEKHNVSRFRTLFVIFEGWHG
jgi:hypothetical protein